MSEQSQTAAPREPLERGWKMRAYKMNPSELKIIDTIKAKRRISSKQVIREALQLIKKAEGLK